MRLTIEIDEQRGTVTRVSSGKADSRNGGAYPQSGGVLAMNAQTARNGGASQRAGRPVARTMRTDGANDAGPAREAHHSRRQR